MVVYHTMWLSGLRVGSVVVQSVVLRQPSAVVQICASCYFYYDVTVWETDRALYVIGNAATELFYTVAIKIIGSQ
jgi:hypothetical protein